MRRIDQIGHMNELDPKKESEDIIRNLRMIKQELKKNDNNVDSVLKKVKECETSMKFILHELR